MIPDAHTPFLDAAEQERLVQEFLDGRSGADNRLVLALKPQVALAVRKFLGDDSADQEDVVSESLMAVLGHIRRRGAFEGNLQVFAVTVARNRCRSLLAWLKRRRHQDIEAIGEIVPDGSGSALDHLQEKDRREQVRQALGALDPECRLLLEEFFLQEKPVEKIRARLGLSTIQGVYYRKTVCVKKIASILNRKLFGGS